MGSALTPLRAGATIDRVPRGCSTELGETVMFIKHNQDEGYAREGGYKGVGTISAIGVVLAVAFMIARPYVERAGWLAFLSTEKGADRSLMDGPQIGPMMR